MDAIHTKIEGIKIRNFAQDLKVWTKIFVYNLLTNNFSTRFREQWKKYKKFNVQKIDFHRKAMEIGGVFKVFVGNISDDVEIETIRSEFQKFGHVADISFDIASGKFSIFEF